MHTLQVASGDVEVASRRRTRADDISVEGTLLGRALHAQCSIHVGNRQFSIGLSLRLEVHAIFERDAFSLQKTDAAVDDTLIEFEVWNTIAEQSTGSLVLLEHGHRVAQLVERVGSSQTGRTSTDDSHLLTVAHRHMRLDVALLEGVLHDGALVLAVGGRLVLHQVQDTSLFAECRTDAARELREGVRGVQQLVGQFPITLVEGVVPLRSLVAQRTSPVAESHTAVHTARSLLATVFFVQRLFHFAEVMNTVVEWSVSRLLAVYCQKCFWISHLFKIYELPFLL